MHPKHEEDLYGWAMANAALLKKGKFNEADMENIIEEMEALGRSEKHELINRLSLVIVHLLKWQFQPNMRGHSWIYTIEEQRKRIKLHLRDNPSLKTKINEALTSAYDVSLPKATADTGLSKKTFPLECPYTFEQIMDEEFYPE